MSFAVPVRPLVLSLALSTSLGFPHLAQAEFIYGRLMPGAGTEADAASYSVDVSADGRTIVFTSASQTWLGDTYNGTRAVAVDLDTGVVDAVSLGANGVFRGESPVVSGDGRYVAFLTYSTSFGPNWQVLRKDRETGALELASADAAGEPAPFGTQDNTVSISADGRYVAFQSGDDLTGAVEGSAPQGSSGIIYVKDMQSGQIEVASVTSAGALASDCALYAHALSGTGRYLVMLCHAAAVPGATGWQTYVRDLQANTTELVSRNAAMPNGASTWTYRPAISPSGRFVAFKTAGYGGLGHADGANIESNSGIYIRDRQAGTTTPIPRPAVLPEDDYDSCGTSAISDVASVVMACLGDWSGGGRRPQTLLYVPGVGTPELISPSAATGQASNGSSGTTLAVNASGLSMAWEANASDIDPNDHNNATDIFVLIEESVITDAIFIDGFDPASGSSVRIAPAGVASRD
jgi:Tol biopolymer transport system component